MLLALFEQWQPWGSEQPVEGPGHPTVVQTRRDHYVGRRENHAQRRVVDDRALPQASPAATVQPGLGPHKPYGEEHEEFIITRRRSDADGDQPRGNGIVRRRGYQRGDDGPV